MDIVLGWHVVWKMDIGQIWIRIDLIWKVHNSLFTPFIHHGRLLVPYTAATLVSASSSKNKDSLPHYISPCTTLKIWIPIRSAAAGTSQMDASQRRISGLTLLNQLMEQPRRQTFKWHTNRVLELICKHRQGMKTWATCEQQHAPAIGCV